MTKALSVDLRERVVAAVMPDPFGRQAAHGRAPAPVDGQLRHVDATEVRETLAYALRFTADGKRRRAGWEFAAPLAAAQLVSHLALSGFVMMRRHQAKPHGQWRSARLASAAYGARAHALGVRRRRRPVPHLGAACRWTRRDRRGARDPALAASGWMDGPQAMRRPHGGDGARFTRCGWHRRLGRGTRRIRMIKVRLDSLVG